MKQSVNTPFPLHTPNLINICIDDEMNGEVKGKIYHCYDKEPDRFISIIELVGKMERFFDQISFPQASTESRSFKKARVKREPTLFIEETHAEVASKRGKKGTFLVYVQYRQNSSWQGEIEWIERNQNFQFYSELEVLKIITNAIES